MMGMPVNPKEKPKPKEKISEKLRLGGNAPISVSFLPSELTEEPRVRSRRKSIVAAVVAASVGIPFLAAVALFLLGWNVRHSEDVLEDRDAQVVQVLAQSEDALGQARLVATKIAGAKQLLDRHPSWTPLFDFLTRTTVPELTYRSLAADAHGGVVLEATAKDYGSIARELAILRAATSIVREVKLSGMSTRIDPRGGPGGIDFTLSISFVQDLFRFGGTP